MKYAWLLLTFISGCSVTPINNKVEEPIIVMEEKALKPPPIETTRAVMYPGKVKFISFSAPVADGEHQLKCANSLIPIFVKNYRGSVYLAESYFSRRKGFDCFLKAFPNDPVLTVMVKPFNYPSERLNVDKKRVDINPKDLKRVIAEKEMMEKVYAKSASYYLFDDEFKVPLDSFITSHYGNRRIFNDKKPSQHLGNDFRAAVGVPIPVSNDGKVVFTGDLFFTGNVVIVDHGLNLFTVYAHLSKIKVTEGSLVKKGDIVGLAGKTGRVSGPHLHWGVKLNGNWVDGFSLVEESQAAYRTNNVVSQ